MENNKPVFYMLVGLPASGKSSESDRLGDVIVRSSDYLRDKLCGDINDMKNNGAVFTILQSLVRADLYHGKNVVYDATNLKASYRVEFLDTLKLLNCKKVCVFVDTIKMSDREDECGTDTDFMVARNEHDEYMTGRIVGVDECWQDGDLNTCVAGLLRGIATIAHSRY